MPVRCRTPAQLAMSMSEKGFDSIEESDEIEDDLLDKAWGLDPDSRLSCQAIVSEEDLVIEIPKYTINQISENH